MNKFRALHCMRVLHKKERKEKKEGKGAKELQDSLMIVVYLLGGPRGFLFGCILSLFPRNSSPALFYHYLAFPLLTSYS